MCAHGSKNNFLSNFSTPEILRSSEISAGMGTFLKIPDAPLKKGKKTPKLNLTNFLPKSTNVEMLLKLGEVGQNFTLGAEISDRNF